MRRTSEGPQPGATNILRAGPVKKYAKTCFFFSGWKDVYIAVRLDGKLSIYKNKEKDTPYLTTSLVRARDNITVGPATDSFIDRPALPEGVYSQRVIRIKAPEVRLPLWFICETNDDAAAWTNAIYTAILRNLPPPPVYDASAAPQQQVVYMQPAYQGGGANTENAMVAGMVGGMMLSGMMMGPSYGHSGPMMYGGTPGFHSPFLL